MEVHGDDHEGPPLDVYLIDNNLVPEWQEPEKNFEHDVSPPSTPRRDFAPRGLARVRTKFRALANPLKSESEDRLWHAHTHSLTRLEERRNHLPHVLRALRSLLEAVTSSIDQPRTVKFIERLRFAIVQSQLLDNPLVLGFQTATDATVARPKSEFGYRNLTASGVFAVIILSFGAASLIRWFSSGGIVPSWKRLSISVTILILIFLVTRAYVRREVLRNIQSQGLEEIESFFAISREYDSANSAALNFIMEVELVSRGYRLRSPIPPISRIEHNSQDVKCVQLRKALRTSLTQVISTYYHVAPTIWGFAEQTELLMLQSQYQFTYANVVERHRAFLASEPQNAEKLQTLKDAAFLFHDIRKMFLSSLLALHPVGNELDRLRFTTVCEALKKFNTVTREACVRVKDMLAENDFQALKSPKSPLSPGHERWRHQVPKLGSMTMNIRNVQAKLYLLQEETSKALNEADDISNLSTMFMSQYQSIGQDLRDLVEAWESGKAALESGIDRNKKRLSSISSVIASPTSSMSGRTIAEDDENSQDEQEPGRDDAWKKLNGDSPPPIRLETLELPYEPEVFEAISVRPPRSMLSREERIVRMKEDRKVREIAKAKADAQMGMMQELKNVLPKRNSARGRFSL